MGEHAGPVLKVSGVSDAATSGDLSPKSRVPTAAGELKFLPSVGSFLGGAGMFGGVVRVAKKLEVELPSFGNYYQQDFFSLLHASGALYAKFPEAPTSQYISEERQADLEGEVGHFGKYYQQNFCSLSPSAGGLYAKFPKVPTSQ